MTMMTLNGIEETEDGGCYKFGSGRGFGFECVDVGWNDKLDIEYIKVGWESGESTHIETTREEQLEIRRIAADVLLQPEKYAWLQVAATMFLAELAPFIVMSKERQELYGRLIDARRRQEQQQAQQT